MNWLDSFAITLVPYFAGAGSLAAFLFFFGKRIFFHILSKDIEKYKSQLGEKAEVLKNQLSIYAFEQNVTYSRIDNQKGYCNWPSIFGNKKMDEGYLLV